MLSIKNENSTAESFTRPTSMPSPPPPVLLFTVTGSTPMPPFSPSFRLVYRNEKSQPFSLGIYVKLTSISTALSF